jgi:hypothetical protein
VRTVRSALGIHVQATLIVAAMLSTPVAAAEFLPNAAEWPTGNDRIAQAAPQGTSHAAPDWEVPTSPLLPDSVLPKTTITPAELEFDSTRATRHSDRAFRNRNARSRPPVEMSRGECSRHKLLAIHCRGWMVHPRRHP